MQNWLRIFGRWTRRRVTFQRHLKTDLLTLMQLFPFPGNLQRECILLPFDDFIQDQNPADVTLKRDVHVHLLGI